MKIFKAIDHILWSLFHFTKKQMVIDLHFYLLKIILKCKMLPVWESSLNSIV
jgi:hypothetical protein